MSSFGDPNHVSHAGELRRASQGKLERGGEDAFASGFANGQGIDTIMTGHPNTKLDTGVWMEAAPDYKKQVGGVLPGYGGHVPRAIHKYGASAVGATPQFAGSPEKQEVEELRQLFSRQPQVRGLEHGDFFRTDPNDDGEEWWPKKPPVAAIEGVMTDFRDEINGVIPKYAGHVPRGKDKYGASAFGKTRTVEGQSLDQTNSGVKTEGVIMGQVRRINTKAEVPFKPTQRLDGNGVVPGYKGHVPNVVNAIGMSTFLSGKGFTEIDNVNMEKMGGQGDLGDSAAAYGMNDQGASSFSDGAGDMDNLDSGPMADGHASALEKSSMAAAGHIDQWTWGDEMALKAEKAKEEAKKKQKEWEAAKRAARGF